MSDNEGGGGGGGLNRGPLVTERDAPVRHSKEYEAMRLQKLLKPAVRLSLDEFKAKHSATLDEVGASNKEKMLEEYRQQFN